jgi:HlyD family secretion protein
MNYETTVTSGGAHSYSAELPGQDAGAAAKKVRNVGLILIGLAILAALSFYLLRPAGGAGADAQQLPVISVITPGRTTIQREITATGTLAARRSLPVGVAGEGGLVVSVRVDAGQWVTAGQVLVVIDRSVQNQQAASAGAQVQVAQADARLAQSNLERALKLVDRGFISTADVDRLTAARDAATARVNVAQAQAGELRARTARLNVVAPASGLVLERNVEPGQVISSGSGALFTIAKGGEMELMAKVGESDLANLSAGVSAEVTPVGSDKVYTGQVWQLAPTINPLDRQGTVRIALPYAEGLRPGGFASASIKSGTVVAPMLPESAIQTDDNGAYVFIAGKDDKVERRAIVTGTVTESGVIISEGLTGSERVVLRAGGFLNQGQTIKPTKVKS